MVAKLIPHRLQLSHAQSKKLSAGQKIRLKHEHLTNGNVEVHLAPRNSKKILTRIARKSGADLQLVHGEKIVDFDSTGGSLLSVAQSLHRKAKPLIRSTLHKAVNSLAPQAQQVVETQLGGVVGRNAARRVSSAIPSAGHHIVNEIGNRTGAYGFVRGSAEAKEHMARLRAIKSTGGKLDMKKVFRAVKPIIRPGLKALATTGLTALGQPEVIAPALMGIDALGDAVGFGVRPKRVKGLVRRGGSFKAL